MLFRTGDQSKDFVLVLATNRPADLDPAVLDRMDEALEFPLPGPEERLHILQIYLDRYIAKAGTSEGELAGPTPLVLLALPSCACTGLSNVQAPFFFSAPFFVPFLFLLSGGEWRMGDRSSALG